jgi:hypothetical protein
LVPALEMMQEVLDLQGSAPLPASPDPSPLTGLGGAAAVFGPLIRTPARDAASSTSTSSSQQPVRVRPAPAKRLKSTRHQRD